MSRDAVLKMLQDRLGLDPESIGASAVDAAIARRTGALRISSLSSYAARLGSDTQEWQALVNEIVVPESWFFRGGELFAYLARHIQALMRRRDPAQPVRILSAACSTGEEPYSLAIALTEAGLPADRWRLDALDVSSRSIEAARRGYYTAFSFREMDRALQKRYFQPVPGGWQLVPSVRAAVHFQVDNLTRPLLLPTAEPYDLLFCRNVLIYLRPAARQQALANLDRLLAADGLLCLGPADPLGELERRFQRIGSASFFLYQRTTVHKPSREGFFLSPSPLGGEGLGVRGNTLARAEPPRPQPLSPEGRGEKDKSVAAPVEPVSAKAELAQARQLADQGRLSEALACCQAHLAAHGPTADCFSLMGVLHQARQEEGEAVRCLLNALYLQPEHAEALLHLMLLRQQQGRHREADLLRRRLERIDSRGES